MSRGGPFSRKRKTRKEKVKKEKNGSEETDEDYTVWEDELGDSEDEYFSSLGEFEEQEDEDRPLGSSSYRRRKKNRVFIPKNNKSAYYSDSDSDEEDSDEEFSPEELDGDDDDDEVCLRALFGNGKKRKMNVRKNKRKKHKRKVTEKGRSKKTNTNSAPWDYEYTMSEEEREQIREAVVFCRRSTSSLLTCDSLKTNGEEEIVVPKRKRQERKRQERKGKEKVVVTKQVCGICLSEDEVCRGILNCCSHFFCFGCIMEWSKVESRCPVCKQRFATISRSDDAVAIPIPERDQVYQPTEEELRGFLYPYENIVCSECHHDGDDALLLLCDFCDSPAHTYCVGLGLEVPQGSWYCNGCLPMLTIAEL